MVNVIAVTGKTGSGKSEVIRPYQEKEYKLIKFADTLKDLICNLINVDREFIEAHKDDLKDYAISNMQLASALNLSVEDITSIRDSNTYHSIRELLQFIGTDIIRKYHPSWHIDNLKAKIVDGNNYCIDDLRFLNEVAPIKELGGTIIRIIRPDQEDDRDDVTSHQSEVEQGSIKADHTIINDGTLEDLSEKVTSIIQTITWDKRFLGLAENVSTWSKDPSTQVGACITDNKNRVVSVGYNGFARGVNDNEDYLNDRAKKLQRTIHAEPNAILFAQRDLTDHTLYVHPFPPCVNCAALIVQSGITKVVAPDASAELKERWADSMAAAEELFKEAGVELFIY